MAKPGRLCLEPIGGGNLCPRLRPCQRHPPRAAWGGRARPSWRERGYDAEYERNRAIVLSEETHCAVCRGLGLEDDEAGHKVARCDGGTNARENLQREHRRCNAAKNARRTAERRRGA